MKARKEAVVKVDFELLKEVGEFINKKENRIRYSNKKQFVDIAVYLLLETSRTQVLDSAQKSKISDKEQNILHNKKEVKRK